MWFDQNVSLSGRRLFPNWFGLRRETTKAAGEKPTESPSAEGHIDPRWPVAHPIREEDPAKTDGSDGHHLNPEGHEDSAWRMGWTDGRSAQAKATYLRLVRAEASINELTRIENTARAAREAQAAVLIAGEERLQVRRDLDAVEDEYREHMRDSRTDRGSYSPGIGLFYAVVGVLLLAADVPLSLLVSRALGLKGAGESANLSISNLRHVFANPLTFWEPLSIALGLAGLGIIFKMVADALHVPERLLTPATRRTRTVLFGALVALILLTFIGVGLLRGMVHSIENKELSAANVATLSGYLPMLSMAVFTLLALAFAAAGAVCFSSGTYRLTNVGRLQTSERHRLKLRELNREAIVEVERRRANADSLQAELQSRMEAAGLDIEFKTALYLHGYARGLAVPETAHKLSTLYDRARGYHERLLGSAVQRENGIRQRWDSDDEPPEAPVTVGPRVDA
jgi:hypothetical protein